MSDVKVEFFLNVKILTTQKCTGSVTNKNCVISVEIVPIDLTSETSSSLESSTPIASSLELSTSSITTTN